MSGAFPLKGKHMRNLLLASFVLSGLLTQAADAPLFFAFDNGVGRGQWPIAQQISTLKELGWGGIGYNYTKASEMAERRAVCEAQGVKLVSMYFYTYIDKPALSDDLKLAITNLKGSGTILWMTIRKSADKAASAAIQSGAHDEQAVAIVQEVSRLARESGLTVSLYHHAGFYVATAAESLRVVRKAREQGCDNVGATVNLCHEIICKQGGSILETIREAGPLINLASINGADALDVPKGKPVLVLGEGGFDVAGVVKALRAAGYKGPIGHQFFNVPGEPRENLTKAIKAWNSLTAGM
jgi:sugar phosphate isomerase/epimerase